MSASIHSCPYRGGELLMDGQVASIRQSDE
jgi:hypothetical protein